MYAYSGGAQSNQEDLEKEAFELNEEKDKNKVDYLSPFLAQYGNSSKVLTKRQAMTAKDECLATLKERLLERANIIQKHLDSVQCRYIYIYIVYIYAI